MFWAITINLKLYTNRLGNLKARRCGGKKDGEGAG